MKLGKKRMALRDLMQSIPEAPVIDVSRTTTVAGGFSGAAASLMDWNWTAIIASTVAIIGLVINFYFSRRRHRMDKEKHAADMERSEMSKRLLQAQIDSYNAKQGKHNGTC